jgi:glycine reductase
MTEKKIRVVHYLNQFFGNIGGEEKAGQPPLSRDGAVGPAMGLQQAMGDQGEVMGTVICGDNYFNENTAKAKKELIELIKRYSPDVVVAGPAFNAGRYGMACGEIGKAVVQEIGIPVVTGMYNENPGVEASRLQVYIVPTAGSAADMRNALPRMAALALKLGRGETLGPPDEEGYIPQGRRVTVFSDKIGSTRAVEMLLKRLKGEPFETELPMPEFDRVEPAPAVKDLSRATVALVCTGGIMPAGNPDRIESASATKYGRYSIAGIDDFLPEEYETIHGGYDPVYANQDPDRILPLDVLRDMEKEGIIGKVHDYFYTTVGTGTSVANSVRFGQEIGKQLKEEEVDAVILTST